MVVQKQDQDYFTTETQRAQRKAKCVGREKRERHELKLQT